MTTRWIVAAAILLAGCEGRPKEKTELKGSKEKMSYSIGFNVGSNLKKEKLDLDLDLLRQGIGDALAGKPGLLSQQEHHETQVALQKEVNTRQSDQFFQENSKREGVVTLASGLQYKVIREGTGETPKAGDTVTVHYRGVLADGTEFDNSYRLNEPVSFPVEGVIAGWQEALKLMKVGSRWLLFVPPKLGYGEQGSAPVIPPNSALIFEIELLSIK